MLINWSTNTDYKPVIYPDSHIIYVYVGSSLCLYVQMQLFREDVRRHSHLFFVAANSFNCLLCQGLKAVVYNIHALVSVHKPSSVFTLDMSVLDRFGLFSNHHSGSTAGEWQRVGEH